MIDGISDTKMTRKEKNAFKSKDKVTIGTVLFSNAYASDTDYKFPWSSDVQWSLTSTRPDIWHSCYETGTDCALDFTIATTDEDDRRLLASEDGVITDICYGTYSANVTIDHSGQTLDYFHIDIDKLSSDLGDNMSISQGKVLGNLKVGDIYVLVQDVDDQGLPMFDGDGDPIMIETIDGCGIAYQTNAHVHLQIRPSTSITMDGWVLDQSKNYLLEVGADDVAANQKGAGTYFSSTNVPESTVSVCQPPANGAWIIDQDCTFENKVVAPQSYDMTITNNSLVTITSTGYLDFNFVDHRLFVHNGSGLLVQSGGRVD